MKLVLIATLIGELTVTSYRSVPQQTDSTPYHTSTTAHVEPGGVAVSQDMLCGACRKRHRRCKHPEYQAKIHYGDWLYVSGYGFRFVNDCMSTTSTIRVKGRVKKYPIRNQIDLWVKTYGEERKVNIKRRDVYKIQIRKENRENYLFSFLSFLKTKYNSSKGVTTNGR